MSLTKHPTQPSARQAHKKIFNITTQVADVLMSMNNIRNIDGNGGANAHDNCNNRGKKNQWKNSTNKLIKTLNNRVNFYGDGEDDEDEGREKENLHVMTEEDIDRLFGRSKEKGTRREAKEGFGFGNGNQKEYGYTNINNRKIFGNMVQFLKMDDESDRFLTGIPEQIEENNQMDKYNEQVVDLTSQFKKNYLVGKIIGEGAYASVRVAIYKPIDKKIAIKIYQKSKIKQPQRKKSVRRQITILSLLSHPNIVKILDVVQTNNHLNIVMQYLPGTSLGSYLKSQQPPKIPQKTCKAIFHSLAKAVSFMHGMNIAHRDIKLQNIILDEELRPKIIDFGFSTCIQSEKKIKIFCGTPSYMAPEVVQRKEYRGEGADMWALGVMLFVCVTGGFPFKGSTDQELYRKINNSEYQKGELIFNKQLNDLIAKLLKVEPEQRITASQMLKHPWFCQSSSSKKKHTQGSLDNNRKRVNTQNSNHSKQNKWAHKTGIIKKVFAQTVAHQNLKLQIKMALKSPKMKQQINSYRLNDKENTLKFLKSQKDTYRGKQGAQKKQKQKISKAHSKIIDLLKIQMKKRENDKDRSKIKKRT